MMNLGTWRAGGLRVLWLGGMANPEVIAQGCRLIHDNARAHTAVDAPFDRVVLVIRPESAESRVRVFKVRSVFGKDRIVQATDTLSALRGLAQVVQSDYNLPVRADSLLIPTEGF